MEYILEIRHEGVCIEQRKQDSPFPDFLPGDQMYIEFDNSNYSEEYGSWWTVKSRSHLLFAQSVSMYTLQLHCEPNPSRGTETDTAWLDSL